MSVLARVGGHKAILRMGQWVSANPNTELELNRLTDAWIEETGGPPLTDPDHEYSVAREILRRMGGRVVQRIVPESRRARAVYVARRQLKLKFTEPLPRERRRR